jgi:hypothetical protein
VQKWHESRRNTPGFRESECELPEGKVPSLEVSSWLQVPHVLETFLHGAVHTSFPNLNDAAKSGEQAAIHAFVRSLGSIPAAKLETLLEQRIAESQTFSECDLYRNGSIKSAHEWIAAHSRLNFSDLAGLLHPNRFAVRNYGGEGADRDRGGVLTSDRALSLLPIRGANERFAGDTTSCSRREIPTKVVSPAELAKLETIGKGGEGKVVKTAEGSAYKLYHRSRKPTGQGPESDHRGSGSYISPIPAPKASTLEKSQRVKDALSRIPIWLDEHLALPEAFLCLPEASDEVAGFEMALVEGAVEFSALTNLAYKREHNISSSDIARSFVALYDLLWELQQSNVVAGDLKFDNILLLPDGSLSLLDADGLGVEEHPCTTFSEGYVDPRLCDPTRARELLVKPADAAAMWYSYMVMLFEALVGTHPYQGGVHYPADGGPEVPDEARALKNLSVFHPHVRIPQRAKDALNALPDDLHRAFREVFEKGERGRPRRSLVSQLIAEPNEAERSYAPHLRSTWGADTSLAAPAPETRSEDICSLNVWPNQLLAAAMHNGKPATYTLNDYNSFKTRLAGPFGTTANVASLIQFSTSVAAFSGDIPAGNGGKLPPNESWVWVNGISGGFLGIPVSKSPFASANIAVQNEKILHIDALGNVRSIDAVTSSLIGRLPGELSLFSGETFGLVFSTKERELMDIFLVSEKLTRITGLPPVVGEISRIKVSFSQNSAWAFIETSPEGSPIVFTLVFDRKGGIRGLHAQPQSDSLLDWGHRNLCAYDIGPKRKPGLAAISPDGSIQRMRCEDLKVVTYSKTPTGERGAPWILLADENRLYGAW